MYRIIHSKILQNINIIGNKEISPAITKVFRSGLVNNSATMFGRPVKISEDGEFVREESKFRSNFAEQNAFVAEPGRYHLYVSLACPSSQRTMITRKLKGLESVVSVTVVDWLLGEQGWTFCNDKPKCTHDTVNKMSTLKEVYQISDPDYEGRVTVPVLWDKTEKKIVNNESSEILRMLNSEFNELCPNTETKELDLYPKLLRKKIDKVNSLVYEDINNGVYKSGFAKSQSAYDKAVNALFKSLDKVEDILSKQRYLVGDQFTEADIRLFVTTVRFDTVYHGLFKCNKKRIIDYPNLWAYTREIYQMPGIAQTVDFSHIKQHYMVSHRNINPSGIVSVGPDLNFMEPHGREEKFAPPAPVVNGN